MRGEMKMIGRDNLTGLADADEALRLLGRWQAMPAGKARPPIHAMMLRLRRFSAINLAYGEAAGDSALVEIGARIAAFAREELGPNHLVARLRGGTFLLAACEPCSRERWQWLAEELAQVVSQPITTAGGSGTLRLWPRLALLRAVPEEQPARMLGRLGEALESGMHNPGQRLCWVDGSVSLPARPAQQLEADLIAALDQDAIEVLFQPLRASADNRVIGAEALARWRHPQLGQIGAGALFAIAERADHVGQISQQIAHKAIHAAAQWPGGMHLSLNITATDLASADFAVQIKSRLQQSGLPPARLMLEISEQALLPDLEGSARRLGQLAALGIRIALDDFGAGFCNFRYLKALPLDVIKLDRSMIEGIERDERDLAVLRGILALARTLGLAVVAEGIEREEQRAIIANEGCAAWQGFLGGQPMPASEFARIAI